MVGVPPSSYGCTWEVAKRSEVRLSLGDRHVDSYLAFFRARTSITGRNDANHGQIVTLQGAVLTDLFSFSPIGEPGSSSIS